MVPFTPELIAESAEAARQFLDCFEYKSYNCLNPTWRDLGDERVCAYASAKWKELDDQMMLVDMFKQNNGLH
jgi:hypothetical protein